MSRAVASVLTLLVSNLISEVFADYHPGKNISLRIGRMPEVFADNSRFLSEDEVLLQKGAATQYRIQSQLHSNFLGMEMNTE
jgi:hypothetical protein